MPEPNYPPVGFYFSISIAGDAANEQNAFKEVSGLNTSFSVEEVTEGGENQFAHRLPKLVKFENLVLKRGIIKADGNLAKWCMNVMQAGLAEPIEPKNVVLTLLNENGNPTMTWQFFNAWPVKWSVSDIEPSEDSLTVETLELSFSYFDQTK